MNELNVPTGSLAERDWRWALARELMEAEEAAITGCSEHFPGQPLTQQAADRAKLPGQQNYRIRVDGAAIVLQFGLRMDGVPKMAEHRPRARLATPSRYRP